MRRIQSFSGSLLILLSIGGCSEAPPPPPTDKPVPEKRTNTACMRVPVGTGDRGSIRQVAVGPSGALWVSTATDLQRLAYGEWRRFGERDGLRPGSVRQVSSTPAGMAVATDVGLLWLLDLAPEDARSDALRAKFLHRAPIRAMAWHENTLWFATSTERSTGSEKSGLYRVALASDGTIGPPQFIGDLKVRQILPGAPGQLLVLTDTYHYFDIAKLSAGGATGARKITAAAKVQTSGYALVDGALLQISNGSSKPLSAAALGGSPWTALAGSSRSPSLWLASETAARQYDPAADQVLRNLSITRIGTPNEVAEDSTGRLWLGTSAGLFMCDPEPSRMRTVPRAFEISASSLPTASHRLGGFTSLGRLWWLDEQRFTEVDPSTWKETKSYTADKVPIIDASYLATPSIRTSEQLLEWSGNGWRAVASGKAPSAPLANVGAAVGQLRAVASTLRQPESWQPDMWRRLKPRLSQIGAPTNEDPAWFLELLFRRFNPQELARGLAADPRRDPRGIGTNELQALEMSDELLPRLRRSAEARYMLGPTFADLDRLATEGRLLSTLGERYSLPSVARWAGVNSPVNDSLFQLEVRDQLLVRLNTNAAAAAALAKAFPSKELQEAEVKDELLRKIVDRFGQTTIEQWLAPPTSPVMMASNGRTRVIRNPDGLHEVVTATSLNPEMRLPLAIAQDPSELVAVVESVTKTTTKFVALNAAGRLEEVIGDQADARESTRPYWTSWTRPAARRFLVPGFVDSSIMVASHASLWRYQSANESWTHEWSAHDLPPPLAASLPDRDLTTDDRIVSMVADGDDVLVLCTGCPQPFYRLQRGKRQYMPIPSKGRDDCQPLDLRRDREGGIWLTTKCGVFRSRDGKAPFGQVAALPNSVITEAHDGTVWLLSGGDLHSVSKPWTAPVLRRKNVGEASELAWSAAWHDGRPRLWLSRPGRLDAIDVSDFSARSYLDELKGVTGQPEPFARNVSPEAKALLAIVDGRLLRLQPDGIVVPLKVPPLEGRWTSRIAAVGDRHVLVTHVSGASGVASRIWTIRPSGDVPDPLDVRFNVTAFTEAARGALLLGTSKGIQRLDADGEPRPLWPGSGDGASAYELTAACRLDDARVLVRTSDGRVGIVSPARGFVEVQPSVDQWLTCASLGPGRALLQHRHQLSVINGNSNPATLNTIPLPRAATRIVRIASCHQRPQDGVRKVVVLADRSILRFDDVAGSPRVEEVADLPDSLEPTSTPALGSIGDDIVIGVPDGALWILSKTGAGVNWKVVEAAEGLRGRVAALVNDGKGGLFVWTSNGLGRLDGQHNYTSPRGRRLVGTTIRATAVTQGMGRALVAVATERGVTLVGIPETASGPGAAEWMSLTRETGLPANDATDIVFAGTDTAPELWVATSSGVVVLSLRETRGPDQQNMLDFEINGSMPGGVLPEGRIYQLRVANDGMNAWFLLRSAGATRIVRWNRKEPRQERALVFTEPIAEGPMTVDLGPSVENHAPLVLVREQPGGWWLWRPGAYVRGRAEASEGFIFGKRDLQTESLEPSLDSALRHVHFALDRADHTGGRQRWALTSNLFVNADRLLVAVGTVGEGAAATEVRGVAVLPKSDSTFWRFRIWLLAVLLAAAAGWIVVAGLRIAKHRRDFKSRVIPYVQGESIKDPDRFFGRAPLMQRILLNLPNGSFALVGEFRIGKTSIQHQLTERMLKQPSPGHVFFPVFVDLQSLPEGDGRNLFRYIGDLLVKFIADPQNLSHAAPMRQRLEGDKYRAIDLQNDVDALVGELGGRLAPKEPMVVLQIDEISLFENIENHVRVGFRAAFVHQRLLKTIMSGRFLFMEEDSPVSQWWNFVAPENIIEVEPLTPREARELITRPVRGRFTFDEAVIERIIARSEGRPLKIQNICADLLTFKFATQSFSRRVRLADLEGQLASAGPAASSYATVRHV